jgi:hypothetical protein
VQCNLNGLKQHWNVEGAFLEKYRSVLIGIMAPTATKPDAKAPLKFGNRENWGTSSSDVVKMCCENTCPGTESSQATN